jgi:sn-glycerol 3-phosphate transport system ATP-binding protein
MAELALQNISKSFDGKSVIKPLDIEVGHGEFVVLLGPSGCGKSTLLRIIAGLEHADTGIVRIGGSDVTPKQPRERDVAMVFQNYALYPHMTVFDNIAFPLRMRRLPKEQVRRQVEQTAQLLELGETLNRKPKTLSGGQRQRVALGRALVRNPKLFLFDEPLSNLDARLRVSMRIEILRLMRTLNATVLYVTHDQEEALTMGDRVAVLSEGVIQQIGSPLEIYDKPANTFVASFIGTPAMNMIPARFEGHRIISADGFVICKEIINDSLTPAEMTVGFRPDDCSITDTDGIPVAVESTEFAGDRRYLHCKFAGQILTVAISSQQSYSAGTSVRITPDNRKLHFFDTSGKRIRLSHRS